MESIGEYEYNTKDLIGHGAFAVVFKGRHKKNHNMVVAIKSITKKNLSKSQNLLGKEIKILKELTELHHENVVALLDCKETPHHVYLVMEYCNGGDLADYLQVKGTLSEDTIRLFLRQLAGAMKALNAKGIVHRDLKPQNILLCYSGSKPSPLPGETKLKIADFGFARFLQDGVMAATLCGSPMYMAPEVIMSLQYDAKADLWSIGTIVFQCLTGKAPFQAQTPQALKQLYEKNANLTPKIPSGTSSELSDLLVCLLKRNAKDRMEFDDFFNHPFHKKIVRPTSPVPVPSRQRSNSLHHQGSSSSRITGSPAIAPTILPSPTEEEAVSDEPCQEMPIAASPADNTFPMDVKNQNVPSSDEHEDFVLVPPNLPTDNSNDNPVGANKRKSSEISGSKTPQSSSPISTSPRPTTLPVAVPPCSRSPLPTSEPIPVPSQKEAYQQIQQSLRESPIHEQHDNNNIENAPTKSPKLATSAPKTTPKVAAKQTDSVGTKMATDVSNMSPPAVQFMIGTPPPAGRRRSSSGGSIGTPPPSSVWSVTPPSFTGRPVLSNSPIRRSVGFSPPHGMNQNYIMGTTFLPPIIGSPTKAGGVDCNNAHMEANCNLAHPMTVPFGTRAQTLPDISGQEGLSNAGIRNPLEATCVSETLFRTSGSTGRLTDPLGNIGFRAPFGTSPGNESYSGNHMANTAMLPYGRSPPPYLFSCDIPPYSSSGPGYHSSSPTGATSQLPFGTSPPNMEGPIVFIAPDLPQETLMERAHNDTLAKLNFVLALVDCILDLARSRSSPISALTESVLRRENAEDQLTIASEAHRRAEQLVLYVRALQMLSSSLTLSRDGLNAGKLQPSSSVKTVVSCMNERYRHCLHMCKLLNTQGLVNSLSADTTSSNITADRLIYGHAIEMCQSAALDELFGNPQECFRRYQTAQILLHSLAQQVNSDDDRLLLNKYKEAVEKRLYILQQQGYIYAYDTT